MGLSEEWPPCRPHTVHLQAGDRDLGYASGLTCLDGSEKQPRCHYFGGIPYAQPPTGNNRFRKSIALPSGYQYGTADKPGDFTGKVNICPQPNNEEFADWGEDCLQCNIWVPLGDPPDEKGLPVLFFIHGGYLQWGHPNGSDYMNLLDTPGKCIVVVPGYRLNVFGFIASEELREEGDGFVGNYGFWDQRLALEWTKANIQCFGGDPANVTISGYSAGAHSVFQQLAHDLFLPQEQQIVTRASMHSNSPGIQPKSVHEAQTQFNDLLSALSFPLSLSSEEKLSRLRAVPARAIVEAAQTIPMHQFRATTDNHFISPDLFTSIDNGTFAQAMQDRNITLLIGECRDENTSYAEWIPPTSNTIGSVRTRLCADYPSYVVDALLQHYCPNDTLPSFNGTQCKDWYEAFGRIYADIQVHALQRGFLDRLIEHGTGLNVRRYRIEWRAERCEKNFPLEMGVTHGTDLMLWFWGRGLGLELLESEEGVVRKWCEPFWGWIQGDRWSAAWGRSGKEVRRLKPDGRIDWWEDTDWERGNQVWNIIRKAQAK